jgi:hypothetical protein
MGKQGVAMKREQRIVKIAGGTFQGIWDGLVWWNDPETGSTFVVDQSALAYVDLGIDLVRKMLAARRALFLALPQLARGTQTGRGRAGRSTRDPNQAALKATRSTATTSEAGASAWEKPCNSSE